MDKNRNEEKKSSMNLRALKGGSYSLGLCAAALVQALTSIVPQETNALHPTVVGIGAIKAGEARNVVPDTCTMCGTVRCSNGRSNSS